MNNAISQYARKKAENSFSGLTKTEREILDILVEQWANPIKRIGGAPIDRRTIAARVDCSLKTVSRSFNKLRELGLMQSSRRFNNSNITKPTNWWRQPSIQSVLHLFFKKYPVFKMASFSLSLLLSFGSLNARREKMSLYVFKDKRSAMRNCLNISHRLARDEKREILAAMKQKIDKILSIERGLLKRGETEAIDKYKLMAFSEECLDYCIEKMKFAKPKYPYRFFLATAFEWCRHENKEPDFMLADTLRLEGIPEFKENIAKALAQMGQSPTVRKDYGRPGGYSKPEEQRKSNEQIMQETKEHHKQEQLAVQRRQEAQKDKIVEKAKNINLEDSFVRWVIKQDIERLQKVGYESEDGKFIREKLALMGIVV